MGSAGIVWLLECVGW